MLKKLKSVLKGMIRPHGKERASTFRSHERPLTELCRILDPKQVLEFGPGFSTKIMLENSQSKIVSIETSREWYETYRTEIPEDRVQLIYEEPGWDLGKLDRLTGHFDLIFVDGGDRVGELIHCFDMADENTVVYLHDAHREDYEPGIRKYPYVYFPERHSCILCKSAELDQRIRSAIPPDYSCKCKYCSSEDRRRYLAQFIEGAK